MSFRPETSYHGYPFHYAYATVDGRSFYVLSFVLDVLVYWPFVAGLLGLWERFTPRSGQRLLNRDRVRLGLVVLASLVVGLIIGSLLLARDTSHREDYESDEQRVAIGDTTLCIGLEGTWDRLDLPLIWDRNKVVSPYRLTIAANVDRTDHTLILHSATIHRVGREALSAAARPGTNDLLIPLCWKPHCQETNLGPSSFCAYFSSPVALPLDFHRDTNVTLHLDVTLLSGTNRQSGSISVPFQAKLWTYDGPYWFLRWWSW